MANRLNRDQILHRALSMVDNPALDAKDRPGGAILANALSLGWLQDALDQFQQAIPMAATRATSQLVIPSATGEVATPSDYIIDVRNGIVMPSPGAIRLRRVSGQEFITRTVNYPSASANPMVYTVDEPLIRVWPTPTTDAPATLWYFALPPVLGPNTRPRFPADWTLIEYVRLRALEWLRAAPAGGAFAYAEQQIGKLRSAGLFGEPEDDHIPFDEGQFRRGAGDGWYSWMGDPIVSQ